MARVLVIAPHADDEVLGCGATMARHQAQGDEVFVWIATNASQGAPELFTSSQIEEIRSEALRAHSILGVEKTLFDDFPAPALTTFAAYKVSNRISELLNQLKPNRIYIPHPGDLHEDHRVIYRAALVAARPFAKASVKEILCYETLSETEWAPFQGAEAFKPNYYVDVSECFEQKLKAMAAFASQVRSFPHSRSLEALEALAKLRGATVGLNRAEAFEVERITE